MSQSAIEAQFQRVADEIAKRWHSPAEIDHYLSQLICDPRGRRQGFPLDVMSDILFLSEIRWWMAHDNASDAAIAPEQFSFGDAGKPG
jgi:hypothetical protein